MGESDGAWDGLLLEKHGTESQAFEEPLDEAEIYEEEGLWQRSGKGVLKSSLEARQGRTREIGKDVSQLLQASGCPQPSTGRSAMEAWIEEGAVLFSEGEPTIEEAGLKTSPLGEFGRVVDPWGGEELRRQAEAKAEKWAEASEAHKRNQERRTLEGRQKTPKRAETEE